jgi:hypothetical protein
MAIMFAAKGSRDPVAAVSSSEKSTYHVLTEE